MEKPVNLWNWNGCHANKSVLKNNLQNQDCGAHDTCGGFPVKGSVSVLRASKGFTNVGKSSIREAKLIYVLRTERVTENSWLVFSLQLSNQSLVSCFAMLDSSRNIFVKMNKTFVSPRIVLATVFSSYYWYLKHLSS